MKKLTALIILILATSVAAPAQIINFQSTTGEFPPAGTDIIGHISDFREAQLQTVIAGVPAYDWFRGCGPTSLGMVFGFYDSHGFPDLFSGDASTQTAAVNGAIASAIHYSDYSIPLDYSPTLLPDKSELPVGDEHANNCIADFMNTSRSASGNYWGWSWSSDVGSAFTAYISMVSTYGGSYQSYSFANFLWNNLTAEIDANRPLVFLVDTEGDSFTDHFITVVGYKTEAGINYYGCYHTWDLSLHWYEYRQIQSGNLWGVSVVYTFLMSDGANVENVKTSIPEMHIWPQPFDDILNISIHDINVNDVNIQISDITGKILYLKTADMIIAGDKITIKSSVLSGLNQGVYLLRIINGGRVYSSEIVRVGQ